jgi:hypothetical protein
LSRLDARIFDAVPMSLAVKSPSGGQAAACRALTAEITWS